jgi:hypothetical protein
MNDLATYPEDQMTSANGVLVGNRVTVRLIGTQPGAASEDGSADGESIAVIMLSLGSRCIGVVSADRAGEFIEQAMGCHATYLVTGTGVKEESIAILHTTDGGGAHGVKLYYAHPAVGIQLVHPESSLAVATLSDAELARVSPLT